MTAPRHESVAVRRKRRVAVEERPNGEVVVAYVHRTTKPDRRKPYVPVALDELDDPDLLPEALIFLLRLRRAADRDETDGILEPRTVESVRAFYGYSRRRLARLLENLRAGSRIYEQNGAVYDANFIDVCKSKAERLHRREQWNAAK